MSLFAAWWWNTFIVSAYLTSVPCDKNKAVISGFSKAIVANASWEYRIEHRFRELEAIVFSLINQTVGLFSKSAGFEKTNYPAISWLATQTQTAKGVWLTIPVFRSVATQTPPTSSFVAVASWRAGMCLTTRRLKSFARLYRQRPSDKSPIKWRCGPLNWVLLIPPRWISTPRFKKRVGLN